MAAAAFALTRDGAPSEEPVAPPVQTSTLPAKALADNVPALSVVLDRDAQVNVIGEKDSYYLVEYQPADSESILTPGNTKPAQLYIEKRFVRLSSETTPDVWTGFAQTDATLFDSALFSGEGIHSVNQNDEITVLDSFDECAFVQLADGTQGYMPLDALGTEPVSFSESAADDSSSAYLYDGGSYGWYSGNEDSGGNGGGSSQTDGWTGGSIDTSTDNSGSDGGDIVLTDPTTEEVASAAFLSAGLPTAKAGSLLPLPIEPTTAAPAFTIKVTRMIGSLIAPIQMAYADEANSSDANVADNLAIVLSDHIPTYAAWFSRNDAVAVADLSEASEEELASIPSDMTKIVVNDQWAFVPTNLIRLDSQEPYTSWEGFAAAGAGFYPNYALLGEATTLDLNQTVTVLDDLNTCYVVSLEGTLGYMAKDQVSTEAYEEPATEEPTYSDGYDDYSYYGGYSYYDGSSSGGGANEGSGSVDAGNTGSSETVIEDAIGGWTEEKL
ncbi:MAG: hypothetical protein Q4C41_01430 [Eggerthellaceae bacterium]|nr:hypothetical protein [Eggerthellaceae bacterium]